MQITDNMPVRIDKYLWAVRLYKTRSLATDACRMGRILINDSSVKPSRGIEGNEILVVRKPPVKYTYRVINPIENRVSPKLVINYLEDLTPDPEKAKLEIQKSSPVAFRKKGTGRPTKKERRVIDRWQDGFTDL
ncbi:MAG: RNA-binding S4 domain-containing protein [Bacteroidales bacterium]|jgi:ribosome-associated heat shock protein Hsp15|nr:RNA-binding S4 domain-containing protein [Bacteroidales bacterium]